MGGHALTPPTDHRLGGPLPHQLANRPRTPPEAPKLYLPDHPIQQAHAVLAAVSSSYPPLRGRLSTCYSPVRHSPTGFRRIRLLVRLACVRHAANVHPEPGSNSPTKLIVSCVQQVTFRSPDCTSFPITLQLLKFWMTAAQGK